MLWAGAGVPVPVNSLLFNAGVVPACMAGVTVVDTFAVVASPAVAAASLFYCFDHFVQVGHVMCTQEKKALDRAL